MTAPARAFTEHVYYGMTKTLCAQCKQGVDGKIIFRDGQVFLNKFCPQHGHQECLISSSVEWYLDALTFVAPSHPPSEVHRPVSAGCPFDCGPCSSHQQKVYLPVIPITSACNLDCPICYTVNKNDDPHYLSMDDFKTILGHLRRQHEELDIINFTGGEPTLHPHLPELLHAARAAGIERLTISTNGLRLLDEDYVRQLAAADARVVLSLDTFRRETDEALLGAHTVKAKLKVLDLLAKHDVTTTILPAIATGYNDDEVPRLLDLVLTRHNLVSLEMHTLTFTGQGGVGFDRKARTTTPDLHRQVELGTGGRIRWRDFVPSPLAHPHCYSICYVLLLADGDYVPFTAFMPRADLFALLSDSLYIEPRERIESVLREAMDRLWAGPSEPPADGEGLSEERTEAVLRALKQLLLQMFPQEKILTLRERQKIAERSIKAIYIHSHMDEESFDVSRIMKCSVGVPEIDGSNIPTCSYNILYREKDQRYIAPKTLERMSEGRRRSLPVLR